MYAFQGRIFEKCSVRLRRKFEFELKRGKNGKKEFSPQRTQRGEERKGTGNDEYKRQGRANCLQPNI